MITTYEALVMIAGLLGIIAIILSKVSKVVDACRLVVVAIKRLIKAIRH